MIDGCSSARVIPRPSRNESNRSSAETWMGLSVLFAGFESLAAGIGAGFVSFGIASVVYPDIPASFVGFWMSLIVAVAVSLLTQLSSPPKPLTDADGKPMQLDDRLGTLPLLRRVD